jgi:hypothetical protein
MVFTSPRATGLPGPAPATPRTPARGTLLRRGPLAAAGPGRRPVSTVGAAH